MAYFGIFVFDKQPSLAVAKSIIQQAECPAPEIGYLELERWSGLIEKELIYDGKTYCSTIIV